MNWRVNGLTRDAADFCDRSTFDRCSTLELTDARARSAKGNATDHKNAAGMASVGVCLIDQLAKRHENFVSKNCST